MYIYYISECYLIVVRFAAHGREGVGFQLIETQVKYHIDVFLEFLEWKP